mmetsp:Transcript_20486/g.51606  ORF Transcript_20486/g.51606 Transcript_20486/m.51606 type:complete len:277 (-) Transcript_20486:150-980(-)
MPRSFTAPIVSVRMATTAEPYCARKDWPPRRMAEMVIWHATRMCSVERAITWCRFGYSCSSEGCDCGALRSAMSHSASPSSRRFTSSGCVMSVAIPSTGSRTSYAPVESLPRMFTISCRANMTWIRSKALPSLWCHTCGSSDSIPGMYGRMDCPTRSMMSVMRLKTFSCVSFSSAWPRKVTRCCMQPGMCCRKASSLKSQSSTIARSVSIAASLSTTSSSPSAASTTWYAVGQWPPSLFTHDPISRTARRRSGLAAGHRSAASFTSVPENQSANWM